MSEELLNREAVIDLFVKSPKSLARAFDITRDDLLQAAGRAVVEEKRRKGVEALEDVHCLKIKDAALHTGFTKYELEEYASITKAGPRKHLITMTNLRKFLESKTNPPRHESRNSL